MLMVKNTSTSLEHDLKLNGTTGTKLLKPGASEDVNIGAVDRRRPGLVHGARPQGRRHGGDLQGEGRRDRRLRRAARGGGHRGDRPATDATIDSGGHAGRRLEALRPRARSRRPVAPSTPSR